MGGIAVVVVADEGEEGEEGTRRRGFLQNPVGRAGRGEGVVEHLAMDFVAVAVALDEVAELEEEAGM